MKQIAPVPTENPHKDDKLVDRIAWCNPKVYDGKCDRVNSTNELEQ